MAATLVERTTAYAGLLDRDNPAFCLRNPERQDALRRIARDWTRRDWHRRHRLRNAKAELQRRWEMLVSCEAEIADADPAGAESPDWKVAALELMIIADLASAGLGFFVERGGGGALTWIEYRYLRRYLEGAKVAGGTSRGGYANLSSPFTACERVPPSVACVQPKTRTPRVGCTLRSLSHHLALLPPAGVVKARWNASLVDHADSHVFNLLVVPYPYDITGRSFADHGVLTAPEQGVQQRLFGVRQEWRETFSEMPDFVLSLVEEAQKDIGHVDGVVLPELALDARTYGDVVKRLSRSPSTPVQFLVSGVLGSRETGEPSSFNNAAVTTVFSPGGAAITSMSMQKKHHRWKLDRAQITQYSLGDALDPKHEWWENARIDDRDMGFYVFRRGAAFTTLVCEDLARADPGQSVIRAIGPNLVIALLMDGPQLPARWPGQYAMGLADDPGSSVLSVTSLGLVRRSNHHHGGECRTVGLWRDNRRDHGGTVRTLDLPRGHQALVLSMTQQGRTEYTLDGRDDEGQAYEWVLSGSLPLSLGHDAPPWARA